MEIEELKEAWKALDAKTSLLEAELVRTRRADAFHRLKARLRRLGFGLIAQVIVGTFFALIGGSYWFDHWGTPHLVVYGLSVHAYGVLLIGLAVAQMVGWRSIDLSSPVKEVQSRIAGLRLTRVRAERMLLVTGAVIWLPLVLMVLKALGWDVWMHSPSIFWANLAFCLVLASGLAWAMMRWPGRFELFLVGGGLLAAQQEMGEDL